MPEHVPVLIIGAGLAGLSAALFLGQHGIRNVVVERRGSTSVHPKARGFNARTMELFRGAGLESEIRAAGADLKDNHDILFYKTLDEPPFQRVLEARDDEPTLRISPTSECMCPQDALEPILLAAARKLGSDIRFGAQFEGLDQDENGVTATVDGQPIRADYLIACDGARSGIREKLGITMSGSAPTFHTVGISFTADLGDLEPFIIAYVGAGLLLPINNRDRWAFHVRFDPAAGEGPDDFTDERCRALIQAATGQPELEIELTSVLPWETTCRLADEYARGRVFLAGDAAHLIPPAGAFGANTAIQDAHNLAWKLAFVLTGAAGPTLLDTYQAERQPVGEITMEQALARWQAWEKHSGEQTFADDLTVIFGPRYVSSAIDNVGPAGPLRLSLDGTPGTRAPHVWLADGASTLDLVGPGFTLLHHNADWARETQATAERLGIPLSSHEAIDEGALLVRPDGYVAWRSSEAVEDLAPILARLLGRRG